uniref:Cytoplasmic tRNA 2-thiolation protein 1 n=1 Tax=Macrostomum lignano TaxID=282301 RepID=A0A1I8H5K8_9PLAT
HQPHQSCHLILELQAASPQRQPQRRCRFCEKKPQLRRPKTGHAVCRDCFFWAFEAETHDTIVSSRMFSPGERVAIGASGGKDSTVLAYLLKTLNERHNYGLDLRLLAIDEGIAGYRDDSLDALRRTEVSLGLPLTIFTYRDLYGWTMDEVVRAAGRRSNCTFCGVFRRQALDRGAGHLKADKLATGHNADDVAETVVMNLLRGDAARLSRCADGVTHTGGGLPARCKPLKYAYEKEIVLYAYFKRLDYFATECLYAPAAYRGHARALVKDLERARPAALLHIIQAAEQIRFRTDARMPELDTCRLCGYVSSQPVCKACVLLDGLNSGNPRLAVGKSSACSAKQQQQRMLTDAGRNSAQCCGSAGARRGCSGSACAAAADS